MRIQSRSFAKNLTLLLTALLLSLAPARAEDSLSTLAPTALTESVPAAAEEIPAMAPPDSALMQRVADLEAYIANGAATGDLAGVAGPGHNGFMMVCAALVLFMTLPGLALFYGGLVRSKNVLSVLAQCLGCAGLVTLLWWAFGYSWAFSAGTPVLGGLKHAFLAGVDSTPNADYGAWTSQSVFAMFQLMFAIITPALMVGAIAERMKYSAVMLFILGWMLVVYFPLAHMVWGVDGLMNGLWNPNALIKSIDFAGGTVVHMSSGWSALVLCLLIGRRKGFGSKPFPPHSLVLTLIGTGMLWVGWYGFNAGSAVGADGIAANAFMTTTLAAAVAGLAWGLVEWRLRGKPTVLGFCSGIVGGLVVITPAAGFIGPSAAVLFGLIAGTVTCLSVLYLKAWLKYDDALDTFGIHGVGGTLGALITGIFANPEINPNLNINLADKVGSLLWLEQAKAMLLTIVLSVVATVVLAYLVKVLVGWRPTVEAEQQGLDLTDHGESGYHYEETL